MVRFGSIEIIELPMVVGDNPSAIGVPVAIDWWEPTIGIEGDDADDDSSSTSRGEGTRPSCVRNPAGDEEGNNNNPSSWNQHDQMLVRTTRRYNEIPETMRCIVPLDQYEMKRPVRRTRRELHMNRQNREEM